MPYTTGTVADSTALKTAIEAFAVSNGWTLSGSGYLSKGYSNVKLSVISSEILRIVGATDSAGTNPSTSYKNTYIPSAYWPATYYFFVHTNPDMFICVLNFNTVDMQTIIFGDLVKVNDLAYVGGNFFFAPAFDARTGNLSVFSDTSLDSGIWTNITEYSTTPGILFAWPAIYAQVHGHLGLHAEIDGQIWDNNLSANNGDIKTRLTDYTIKALYRSPNSWNNQAHLIPIHIQYEMANNLHSYLGYVEHLRYIRIENYNIGDIVTLGTDKWKVFPWVRKSITWKYGSGNTNIGYAASGTIGLAARYDGA